METSREGSLKFFAINLAECITWKEHRDLVKNKASKCCGESASKPKMEAIS